MAEVRPLRTLPVVQKSGRPCENLEARHVAPKFRRLLPRRPEEIAKIGSLLDPTEPRIEFSHGLQEFLTTRIPSQERGFLRGAEP